MGSKVIENTKTDVKEIEIEIKKENKIIPELIRRLIDIVIGVFGIILLIPITIVIYIARKILKEDNGPIFYEQLRIGKDGKYFRLYKYRTMVVGADEKLREYLNENENAKEEFEKIHKLKDDPRITKLGKFLRKTSIDEMPQFLNVFIGNMHLVGPRPYLPYEKKNMNTYYEKIITCKPGITGLWQINGRNETTFEERLKADIYYINNKTLLMDIKIFFKTIIAVITRNGAL